MLGRTWANWNCLCFFSLCLFFLLQRYWWSNQMLLRQCYVGPKCTAESEIFQFLLIAFFLLRIHQKTKYCSQIILTMGLFSTVLFSTLLSEVSLIMSVSFPDTKDFRPLWK
jgi:hypothetical protein